ncbi:MAG: hypothetical protein AAB518_01940 [Patescibacteria group bacterium]
MNKTLVTWAQFAAVAAFLTVGFMVVEGAWFAPQITNNQPTIVPGVVAPLNTGNGPQLKGGGLRLNTNPALAPQLGLIIYGDDVLGGGNGPCNLNSRDGCIKIGDTAPSEKLSIDGIQGIAPGDFKIDGLIAVPTVSDPIAPNPTTGNPGEVLTISQNGDAMTWSDDKAWMTIQRVDIRRPGAVCATYFPQCPTAGPNPWAQYGSEYGNEVSTSCNLPPSATHWAWQYRKAYRACVKPIP